MQPSQLTTNAAWSINATDAQAREVTEPNAMSQERQRKQGI